MSEAIRDRDIAVVGMAGRFPGARDLDAYWRMLCAGREAVTFFSDDELRAAGVPEELIAHPDYVKAGSVMEGVDEFDAGFFGYTAREAEIMDPQQRLFLEHAWAALENAGYVPESFDGLIGVYAGVAWNTYLLSNLREHRDLFEGGGAFQVFITNDKDFMPTRASYKLDLKGPSMIVQTSCSTSLVAIHLAALSLLNYECDMALAGGVTVKVPQTAGYLHQDGGLASPDGHCRAFDADAAGTIFGSGVGLVVLKRLTEAVEDGDTVRAVLRGSAINNDGSVKVSYTAPSVEGQAEVVAAAQAVAEVAPETVGYVECHGTGTSLGDPIEVAALSKVFRESSDARDVCALGSVKSNVGHLDAAAGVAGFIKTVLALEHGRVPPTVNYERPNPRLDLEGSPFRIAESLADWPRNGTPRRAGVSSFGVGGTNAHAVLQEAPEPPAPAPSRPWQLLTLSARSSAALEEATGDLHDALRAGVPGGGGLADVAHTLQRGRRAFSRRRFLVVRDRADALAVLEDREAERLPAGSVDEDLDGRPVVFLLPGQGSQHPGMARALYQEEPLFRQEVDRCAELLRGALEIDGETVDLRSLIFPAAGSDPDAAATRLEDTRVAQPALFAVELALARLWQSWGVEPAALLGHSLGELVAATLAGVFRLEDAVRLVATRGRLMGEAPAGRMLAVPLPADEMVELLDELEAGDVDLAAVNEPERCAVAGPAAAIETLETLLAERDVPVRRLHTSHAFHSRLMEPAVEPFRRAVEAVELSPPEIPFVSNLSGTWISAAEATDPDYWARQLREPVRFADGLGTLLSAGEERLPGRPALLEVGPGSVLTTLGRRHPRRDGRPVIHSLPHPRQTPDGWAGNAQASTLNALGRLWLAGVAPDWRAFYGGEERRRVPLPTYPFQRRRYWIDAAPRSGARRAAGSVGSGKRHDVGSWFHRPSWEESAAVGPPRADALPDTWLVLTDGPTGDAVVERLREAGKRVTALEPAPTADGLERRGDGRWALRPERVDDWAALAGELGEAGPGAVVHAWCLDGVVGLAERAVFDAAQERGSLALMALLRAFPERPVDLTVVADGVLRVTAGEPSTPHKTPLLGVVRVLPQERAGATARVVDPGGRPATESAARQLAGRLLAEVADGGDDEEVALRGGQRWVRTYRAEPLPEPAEPVFREGALYAVSGATVGNGLAIARYLARQHDARLLLLEDSGSATDAEAAERRARADEIAALGGAVELAEIDLTDVDAVAAALAAAEERCGPLRGVLHAAGTYGERTFRVLAETGAEEAAWHLRPKVHALAALDAALARRPQEAPPPDVLLVVSSLATVLGGLAYGAYTGACAAADAWVEERNRTAGDGVPWLAADWDVWQLEGEAEQITGVRADLAELAMSPREGEEVLRRVIASGAVDRLLVSTEGLAARLERRRDRIAAHAGDGGGEQHPRPEMEIPYAAPESELEQRIAAVWGRLLGFERIGLDDNFFELGGDSFVAVRVASQLKDELGVELPVAKMYEALTVRALARLLGAAETEAEERAEHLEERRKAGDRRREVLSRRRERVSR